MGNSVNIKTATTCLDSFMREPLNFQLKTNSSVNGASSFGRSARARRQRPVGDNAGQNAFTSSRRTTQAQRRRPRDAPIATATRGRRSLQRLVRRHVFRHSELQKELLNDCIATWQPAKKIKADIPAHKKKMRAGREPRLDAAQTKHTTATDTQKRLIAWRSLMFRASNDPSSATRRTGRNDCNQNEQQSRCTASRMLDALAGFAAAHG